MPAFSVEVNINSAAMQRLVRRGMSDLYPRLGNRIVNNARSRAPGPGNSIARHPRPGEPTGNLRNSIGWRAGPDSLEVFASAHYARYVHDGTRRMRARPFLRDAMVEEVKRL